MVGEHAEVLGEVANTFPGRRVVVIGAAALRWHFPRFRGTMDLDLCVAMDRQEHADNTLFPASWRRSPRLPHRWHRSDGRVVDVLPAGDEVVLLGRLQWPDGTELDMAGIDLAMRDQVRYAPELPVTIGVASRRALFLTKVVAWLDRPADRQKDLGDIAMLLDDYADVEDPRRFDEPLVAGWDWDERPALLLGLDLRRVAKPAHLARVRQFVARVVTAGTPEHAWLRAAAPAAWRAEATVFSRRFEALCAGLGEP